MTDHIRGRRGPHRVFRFKRVPGQQQVLEEVTEFETGVYSVLEPHEIERLDELREQRAEMIQRRAELDAQVGAALAERDDLDVIASKKLVANLVDGAVLTIEAGGILVMSNPRQPTRVPNVAWSILAVVCPREDLRFIVGDIEEEYALYIAERGLGWASFWLWAQVTKSFFAFLWSLIEKVLKLKDSFFSAS